MAVKIRLKRMGKIRAPFYRVVVMDSRTKRDGRAIEEIGKYHPTEEPSLIEIDSERAQYWLGSRRAADRAVEALLKVTGDWQKFKGLPGAEGTLKVKEPKTSKKDAVRGRHRRRGQGRGRQGHLDHSEEEGREEGRGARRRGCRGCEERGLTVLEEALEHLVRGIVDHPDDVAVRRRTCAAVRSSRSASTRTTSAASSADRVARPARCAP